jgi:DNA replication protein DnaD
LTHAATPVIIDIGRAGPQTAMQGEQQMFDREEQYKFFGATAVENLFLREYMPAAKGDYVKVYLCALYHSQYPGSGYGLQDIALELSLPQTDVMAALRYWERRKLILKTSENPPAFTLCHMGHRMLTGQDGMETDAAFIAFSEAVYALFADRRKVRPGEIALAFEWVQELGLPQEVVLMLLSHLSIVRGMQFSFKAAEPFAVQMREENVMTPEDAESFLSHTRKAHEGARAVLRRMGKRRLPSEDELTLYIKWTGEWGYSHEAILAACGETVKGEPTFAYLDGILGGIRNRGSAKTGAQVSSQLGREQDSMARARELANSLGTRTAPATLLATYERLRETHPHEVIMLAAREASRTGSRLEDAERLLAAWHKKGLDTEEAVREYLRKFRESNDLLMRMFEACGHESRPTASDRALLNQWQEWGFSDEMLLLAAAQARSAKAKPPYIHKVLETWHQAGVNSPGQVTQNRPLSAAAVRPGKEVGAHRYSQRDYTSEELNALSVDLMEEARKYNDEQ